MNDNEQQNDPTLAAESAVNAGGDAVIELNFVPSWARRPPDMSKYGVFAGGGERYSERPRGGDRRGFRDRDDRRRDDRPRRHDRDDRRRDRRGTSESERFAPGPQQADTDQSRDGRRPFVRRQLPEDLGLRIRFIPCPKQLASVVRQVRSARKAYPLFDMAALFLADPQFCHVIIDHAPRGGESDAVSLCQCRTCKSPALDEQALAAHVMAEHMGDYFTRIETEIEAPAGQFNCVARCGFTGILLGPPNHHSYAEKVLAIHRERFPDMPIDTYRNRIEMVRTPEAIEQWKQESRKQVMCEFKTPVEGMDKAIKPAAAEQYLSQKIAPGLVLRASRAVCPMSVATKVRDQRLLGVLRTAWQREIRQPVSLAMALRGAFKGLHMHTFKAGGGHDFVTSIRPAALDPEAAIESIREVLKHLQEHPGCTRQALVEALRPGVAADAPEVTKGLLGPLSWLIERGHIIEFFNGTLSVPLRASRPVHQVVSVTPPAAAQ